MAPQENNEHLSYLRHSAAHLLAAAVLELWPHAKPTIGPAIEQGFYYDFDFGDASPSEDDLPAVEQKMREIVKEWDGFSRKEVTAQQARDHFSGNQYKQELIDELEQEGATITLYQSGGFIDLCRGGHIEDPRSELTHFKLLSVAGAYWRGDENNPMLTRIYGTAFSSHKELQAYLSQREEAMRRDHKKLGKKLNLFAFSPLIGSGLPLFTPRGAIIRTELERFIEELNKEYGYQKVWIPHLAKPDLYHVSGHWEKFKDDLFHVKGSEDAFVVKPMNCPHHTQIYASSPRSWRDLPVRFHETTTVYRDEKTGQLSGLTRVRSITQDDGHTFLRPDQIEEEFDTLLAMQRQVLAAVGISDYWISLSLRDPENKDAYLGDDASWDHAENTMRELLKKKEIAFKEVKGEAAFYGPKMDLMARDAIGREWQLSTIQLDFNMPRRFKLEYIDKDGKKKMPFMIHRAFMGSVERFIGVLIEHFAGAFPVWLAPVQVQLIPVGSAHNEFCRALEKEFSAHGIRSEINDANETVGNKIRKATSLKVPYMLVIGDKEISSPLLHVRKRGSSEVMEMEKESFLSLVTEEIKEKKIW